MCIHAGGVIYGLIKPCAGILWLILYDLLCLVTVSPPLHASCCSFVPSFTTVFIIWLIVLCLYILLLFLFLLILNYYYMYCIISVLLLYQLWHVKCMLLLFWGQGRQLQKGNYSYRESVHVEYYTIKPTGHAPTVRTIAACRSGLLFSVHDVPLSTSPKT